MHKLSLLVLDQVHTKSDGTSCEVQNQRFAKRKNNSMDFIDIEQNDFSTPHIRAQKMFVYRKHVCNSDTSYQQSIKDVDNPTIQRELANIQKKKQYIPYICYC
jgi:hypothetical protein